MDKMILEKIGIELKSARLANNLTLKELSIKLKIRKPYLLAIENGSINILKLNAYIINYIKRYAEFFDLNYQIYLQEIKDEQLSKLSPIASKNLITGKEFLPSFKVFSCCTILLIIMYLFI